MVERSSAGSAGSASEHTDDVRAPVTVAERRTFFIAEWQSFRSRGLDGAGELTFEAKFSYHEAGRYRIAARVTDVFGNDGIATVEVEVRR